MSVLVLIEPDDELSLQAVTLARTLGDEVHGIAFGAADAPVDVLHVAEIEGSYAPAGRAAAIAQLIELSFAVRSQLSGVRFIHESHTNSPIFYSY